MADKKYHGHVTMTDGTRVPLTEDAAKEIWAEIEAEEVQRAKRLPTARSCLEAISDAAVRLGDLGWSKGGGLRVRRGDECAVAQPGSSGMWSGRVDANGRFVVFGGCVAKPQDVWLKPLADLTDDERQWMEECDRNAAEALSAWLDRQPQQEPSHD